MFILFIGIYKYFFKPFLPISCRFNPTCSQYFIEAFSNYNFFLAILLSFLRILKCNLLFKGGHDPVI